MKGSKTPFAGIPGATNNGQPLPSFRRSNRNVGAGAGTSVKPVIVFNPNGAASVRWILVQTSAACTLQLLLNQQPFSLPITVGAGAIIRFAGLFLANNEVLAVSVTANSTLNFEVAWLKEIHPDTIVKDTAVIYAGATSGTANVDIFDSTGLAITAASDAPIGTESAIISRDILRKKQTLLTSTPLAANGIFTSPWFDTELTGTNYVSATSVSNAAGAPTVGLTLMESEDQVNVLSLGAIGAATILRTVGYVRARYWRVVYTNGAGAQATFSLYATETAVPFVGDNTGSQTAQQILPVTFVGALQTLTDGFNNQSGASWGTSVSPGLGQARVTANLFNGATWDRQRTPAIFKQVSTAATGSTALWTPAAGKKFRLMGYRICVTALAKAAAAADLVINLLDAAAGIGQSTPVTIPVAAAGNGLIMDSGWIDLGNGILSALANNVLNLNLSFALTGGLVNITACGTEE